MKDEATANMVDRDDNETPAEPGGPTDLPAPRLHSTRGGSGTAAGATPKKASRPESRRPRPAGKKPDNGPR